MNFLEKSSKIEIVPFEPRPLYRIGNCHPRFESYWRFSLLFDIIYTKTNNLIDKTKQKQSTVKFESLTRTLEQLKPKNLKNS